MHAICYSMILFPTFVSCVKGADDSTVASAVSAAYSRSHPSTYGRSHCSTDRSPVTAANSGEWASNVMYVFKWAGGRLKCGHVTRSFVHFLLIWSKELAP